MDNRRKHITLGLFIALLIVQISLLHKGFSWPTYSLGEYTTSVKKDPVTFHRTVQQAYFASYAANERSGIIFTGDVLLARNVEYLIEKNGQQYPFAKLQLSSLLPGAAVIGNFESAMPTEHQVTPALAMRFSVNPSYLSLLVDTGFTHLSQANNHSYDYGKEGFTNATLNLIKYGLIPFGDGHTLGKDSITYINTSLGRIAVIGIHATEVIPSRSSLKAVMSTAGAQSDFQIIYIHWGTEYKTTHSPVQEELATILIQYGADLIIGHHPHVVQDIESINNVLVFYSLGNYLFDQYFDTDVQEGLLVLLSTNSDNTALRLLPVSSLGHLSQPALMNDKNRRQFLAALAKRSDSALRQHIIEGILPLDAMVASSLKMAMMVR